jgi:hypothetical protein
MEKLSDSILQEFNNQNTIRHISAKPPKEAYLYFPKQNELIDFDSKNPKRLNRRIFEGATEYNEFEKEELCIFKKELKAFIADNIVIVEDSLCLRFLQASSFDHIKALKMMSERLNNSIGKAIESYRSMLSFEKLDYQHQTKNG